MLFYAKCKLILILVLFSDIFSVSLAETWETVAASRGVYGIAIDSQGTVWMAAGDILRYDHGELKIFSCNNLPDTHFCDTAITVDDYDNVWCGGESGLTVFDGEEWNGVYKTLNIDEAITTITAGENGKIWIGTIRAGAAMYDGESWTWYTQDNGLADDSVKAIAVDPAGVVWVGTARGLSRFDGISRITYTTENGLQGNEVTALFMDSSHNLWCATKNNNDDNVLSYYDGETWKVYQTGLESVDRRITINSIIEDNHGNIWVAGGWYGGPHNVGPCEYYTIGGIALYDGDTWTLFTKEGGMPNDAIQCLAVEKDDSVIIGTICGCYKKLTSDQTPVEHDVSRPFEVKIIGNYPNPFNPTTTIEFMLTEDSFVKLSVVNVMGQTVRTLVSANMSEGRHFIVWDGKDNCGTQLSSGVYFSVLDSSRGKKFQRMLLMR